MASLEIYFAASHILLVFYLEIHVVRLLTQRVTHPKFVTQMPSTFTILRLVPFLIILADSFVT